MLLLIYLLYLLLHHVLSGVKITLPNVANLNIYAFGVSWVAHLVKNPPAVWETRGRSLCWEDPLEKGEATHSRILGLPL